MRISDWSSDVCSSDLAVPVPAAVHRSTDLSAGAGAVAALPGRVPLRLAACHDLLRPALTRADHRHAAERGGTQARPTAAAEGPRRLRGAADRGGPRGTAQAAPGDGPRGAGHAARQAGRRVGKEGDSKGVIW